VNEDVIPRLRAAYQQMSRGEMRSVLGLLDPEIEIRDRPESPDASEYHGHQGALASFQKGVDMFASFELFPEAVYEGEDEVVVVLRMRGVGKESGAPVEDRIAHHLTLRGEKAVRLQVYSDPADALRAAGISDERLARR
jgi:uncharacterized protein